ncbi:MAG: hypothetical protein ACOH1Y_08405 [Propionicimonas sp.]
MPAREDGTPDLLAIIGAVQEWAIDELGYGWPEIHDAQGGFVALLEPGQSLAGCVWCQRGSARVAVGELSSLAVNIPRPKD